MMNEKTIRVAYYVLADNKNLLAGQWKYYITSVWADEIRIEQDGIDGKSWFSLWTKGKCVLADEVARLHAIKATCADYEYEYVKDIRS